MHAVIDFFGGRQKSYSVHPPRPNKKYSVEFCHENQKDMQTLVDRGFLGFDDFWNLPQQFVDDVNYRRGGWSAVSKLSFVAGNGRETYFVKRQENQFRYSLGYPFGRLTFEIEIEAIRNSRALKLPCVDVAYWGVRRASGSSRAVLVTRAIDGQSLAQFIASNTDWNTLKPVLKLCGEQLFRMHSLGVRHGALYPKHIFLNADTNSVRLIDFENSRRYRKITNAINPDLQQLLKRLDSMPAFARDVLLRPYLDNHFNLLVSPQRAMTTA